MIFKRFWAIVIGMVFYMAPVNAAPPITLLSYNVYFDDASGEQRYPNIIDLMNDTGADMVCLQEVTPQFFKRLQQNANLRTHYHFFPASLSGDYGNVILSKLPFEGTGMLAAPSDMGRRFPFANINFKGQSVRVINVHLESLDDDRSKRLRRKQLDQVESILETNTLLVGDFNFGDEDTITNQRLAAMGMVDAYSMKGIAVIDVTYNPDENPLAKQTRSWFEPPRRLDRVFSTNAFKVKDFRVLKVQHSDHYPVLVDLIVTDPD